MLFGGQSVGGIGKNLFNFKASLWDVTFPRTRFSFLNTEDQFN